MALTKVFQERTECRDLLRGSRLGQGAEVEGKESGLLFAEKFINEKLASKWFH